MIKTSIFKSAYVEVTLVTCLLTLSLLLPLQGQNTSQNPSFADRANSGLPFIRNYPANEYRADGQNWATVQDQRGLMYFGNSDGVVEYDGISWRTIATANKTVIRSLAVDENNRIYVGAFGEIGYLAPDTIGRLQYISLLPYVDEKYRDFSDVWQTIVAGDGVYFGTQKYLFRWAGGQMRVWESSTLFLLAAWVNDQLYVREREKGLLKMVSDSLIPAPGSEPFIQPWIPAILPAPGRDKNKILVCTQREGLFLYDGLAATPFPTTFDARLNQAGLYQAVQLPNGNYALSTMQDGVFIMDEQGKLQQHLNKATGLQHNTVWALYPDQQGGLWMGLDAGISRAEISAPLTQYTGLAGVEGNILDIVRHQGRLYIATSTGVSYLDEAAGPPGLFKPVRGIPPQCWKLLSVGQSLLAGTFQGVYEIKGDQADLVAPGYVFYLHRSGQDTNRIFMGLQGGMGSLYYDAEGRWRQEGVMDGIDGEIRDILETPDGKLWLTTRYQGLLQLDFPDGFTLKPEITRFDTLQGLPKGDRSLAFTTSRGLYFATPRGIYRLDEERGQFLEDSSLIKGFPNGQAPLFRVAPDRRGNLWLMAPDGPDSGIARRRKDGSYSWDKRPLLRIDHSDLSIAYPDPLYEGITWFGGVDRLIRYDASIPKNEELELRVFIRQVLVNGDSMIHGGSAGPGRETIPALAYGDNSLRLMYATPSFDEESKNEYQYFLEGYDEGWSNWSTESRKDYTNLRERKYRFLVRAKNIYGQTSQAVSYEFEVLPPFYRSWWAYLMYGLLILASFYLLRQYEVKRLSRQHLREMKLLEYDKLKELDQLKSRFFANISHEFRTPLTLILGPLDNLVSRHTGAADAHDFKLMRRNAQRLLRLINQLLDLSKLEAGKMKLEAIYSDIIPFVKNIFYSFESLAASKGIRLQFATATETVLLYFDPDKLEPALINILSNAFKFTPEGGTVSIQVAVEGPEPPGGMLRIGIADTGPGIAAEHLGQVFDRFYGSTQSVVGGASGIGLALAQELVELHRGRISVASQLGQGAEFTIRLPLGHAHLPDGEIAQAEAGLPLSGKDMHLLSDDEAIATDGEPLPVFPALNDGETMEAENILLLVEDNPDMRAFIRNQLEGSYRIEEAEDGLEGVAKAIELIPDLIISDVMMPGMDGLQLCDTLKNDERSSHIPIILLTARADVESRLQGLERGADAYLAKPFNREELLVRSRKLLELRRRLRERYASLQPPAPAEEKDLQIEDAFLQKIRGIVTEHLSDHDFSIDQLSRAAGMSRSQLFRKIKALTGQSPSLFIRSIRLQRAKVLLQTTDMSVAEIAYEVGFSTPSYFSATFLETFGIRPTGLRP